MLDQPNGWTEARETKLRELWVQRDISAAEVARILGGGLSKMAVISRAHKLKLPLRRPPNRTEPKAPIRAIASDTRTQIKPDDRGLTLKGKAWQPLPGTTPVPYELATGCRWQYGDGHGPQNPTCNEPVHLRSFCRAHFDIAYPKGWRTK